mmetsp:Transcript_25940/g.53293  ORF Transcript_25940/g.53293 Transcript_25940/m.53293 type:complete len:86 (+) Transcript_25940:2574-2831(+)
MPFQFGLSVQSIFNFDKSVFHVFVCEELWICAVFFLNRGRRIDPCVRCLEQQILLELGYLELTRQVMCPTYPPTYSMRASYFRSL